MKLKISVLAIKFVMMFLIIFVNLTQLSLAAPNFTGTKLKNFPEGTIPIKNGLPDLSVTISESKNQIVGQDGQQTNHKVVDAIDIQITVSNLTAFASPNFPGTGGTLSGSDIPGWQLDAQMGSFEVIHKPQGVKCQETTVTNLEGNPVTLESFPCVGGSLPTGSSLELKFSVISNQACGPNPISQITTVIKPIPTLDERTTGNNSATSNPITISSVC
jgi:hypothetical protein